MTGPTRAEVCAVAVAEAFRGDGEILASSFGTIPAVGARLARLSFSPDLLMTDGIATLLADTPPVSGSSDADPVVDARDLVAFAFEQGEGNQGAAREPLGRARPSG